MSRSDPDLVRDVMERMARIAPAPALLHPLPPPASHEPITDVDLVWGRRIDAGTINSLLEQVLEPMGLRLLVVSPYDHDAAALFVAGPRARAGVHLDLVHDATASGRLGIYYPRFLERADGANGELREIDSLDRLVYLARKRHWKRQWDELRRLRSDLKRSEGLVRSRGPTVLTRPAWRDVAALLVDGPTIPRFTRSLRSRAAASLRLARRVQRPVGAWIHLDGDDGTLTRQLADRFKPLLVHSVSSELAGSRSAASKTWLSVVAPVRWRPGLVLSFGALPRGMHPDAVIPVAGGSPDAAADRIVDHLNARAARTLLTQ
jgi:hypothetical protein